MPTTFDLQLGDDLKIKPGPEALSSRTRITLGFCAEKLMDFRTSKKCANCGKKLSGRMLFYPKLCLCCVIEIEEQS